MRRCANSSIIISIAGRRISTRKFELPAYGFDEIEFDTLPTSPTGQYTIAVHVVKDGRRGSLLGSTAIRVEEFLPDRMRITARIEPSKMADVAPGATLEFIAHLLEDHLVE